MIEKALRQAELVVVQDAYHPTATSSLAHVILPAAQWSEKEGVMTNSERRMTYMPKLSRSARRGAAGLANHRALRRARWVSATHFAYQSSKEIFAEYAALTKEDSLRLLGHELSKAEIESVAVALSEIDTACRAARLYADGIFPTADGRANFIAVEHAEPAEMPDDAYPLVLTTGRSNITGTP